MSCVPVRFPGQKDALRRAGWRLDLLRRLPRGREEPAPLGRPAPGRVGSRGAVPPPLSQWQSSRVPAGGSPALLKTVLETAALQHCAPFIGRNK